MKGTEEFKKTIQEKLNEIAETDPVLQEAMKKEKKNIDDCITCILNTVKDSGCNGFADSEIYQMAINYYLDDKIKAGGKLNCDVIVNHRVELTEKEKEELKEKAKNEVIRKETERLTTKKKRPTKPVMEVKKNDQQSKDTTPTAEPTLF